MIAAIVYFLSALTCATCSLLLFRRFVNSGERLLMWSALCFIGLTINNGLLIVDLLIIPGISLAIPRLIISDASIAILVFGLIWDSR